MRQQWNWQSSKKRAAPTFYFYIKGYLCPIDKKITRLLESVWCSLNIHSSSWLQTTHIKNRKKAQEKVIRCMGTKTRASLWKPLKWCEWCQRGNLYLSWQAEQWQTPTLKNHFNHRAQQCNKASCWTGPSPGRKKNIVWCSNAQVQFVEMQKIETPL